jgi:hypothetical protein
MDGQHFDTLLKTVTARGSRRRMLRGLLAGALGVGAVTALRSRSTAAPSIWCECTYACPSEITVRCQKSGCPGTKKLRGETCSLLSDLVCGTRQEGVCKIFA